MNMETNIYPLSIFIHLFISFRQDKKQTEKKKKKCVVFRVRKKIGEACGVT